MAYNESHPLREYVRQRANHRCEYCMVLDEDSLDVTVFCEEHIIPKIKFEDNDPCRDHPDNLAWACPRCNGHKWQKVTAEDPATNELVSLFNPRTQKWTEHFSVSPSGHINGLSPVGRATVQALGLNFEERVKVRLRKYTIGSWPGF